MVWTCARWKLPKRKIGHGYQVTNNPSIAVFLAAYNGMEWIEEQVAFILYQKNTSIEILKGLS